MEEFWRSVNLTGNQTTASAIAMASVFWRSVNLTGNQTVVVSSPREVDVLAQCQSDW